MTAGVSACTAISGDTSDENQNANAEAGAPRSQYGLPLTEKDITDQSAIIVTTFANGGPNTFMVFRNIGGLDCWTPKASAQTNANSQPVASSIIESVADHSQRNCVRKDEDGFSFAIEGMTTQPYFERNLQASFVNGTENGSPTRIVLTTSLGTLGNEAVDPKHRNLAPLTIAQAVLPADFKPGNLVQLTLEPGWKLTEGETPHPVKKGVFEKQAAFFFSHKEPLSPADPLVQACNEYVQAVDAGQKYLSAINPPVISDSELQTQGDVLRALGGGCNGYEKYYEEYPATFKLPLTKSFAQAAAFLSTTYSTSEYVRVWEKAVEYSAQSLPTLVEQYNNRVKSDTSCRNIEAYLEAANPEQFGIVFVLSTVTKIPENTLCVEPNVPAVAAANEVVSPVPATQP